MKRIHHIRDYLDQPVSIAPLVTFRVVFGAVMVFSTLRFWWLGWIEDHYIDTQFTFKYYGFEWVQLLPPVGMYALHAAMLLGALGVTLGWRYRWSAALFFLAFTYTELIDLTYYLNHYYFVSITSLLLIFVPAHRRFSLDCRRDPALYRAETPRWTIGIFQLQIAIVYFYAGIAKINHDWLVNALPLKIWAPANDTLPLIGPLFQWEYTPYLFSWIGMLYDTTIVFWLSWRRTRAIAYLSVVVFHTLTGLMFQIGVFPLVMMGATWIYFSERFHERLLGWAERGTRLISSGAPWAERGGRRSQGPGGGAVRSISGTPRLPLPAAGFGGQAARGRSLAGAQNKPFTTPALVWLFLISHFTFQLCFPFRYQFYPDNLFWTEEGYRFSWRVMLMEKAGTATFYVKDTRTGREGVVDNVEFLKPHQEKQMAMQPDMILQYAHFLAAHYEEQGLHEPKVRAEVYVTLNARPSRLLVDPGVDLTKIEDGWRHREWGLPYEVAPRTMGQLLENKNLDDGK